MTLEFWLTCVLRCCFTMNSRVVCDTYRNSPMDRSKRINLRWFRTLQQSIHLFSTISDFGVTLCFMLRDSYVIQLCIIVEGTCTSESMNPRPCFNTLQYRLRSLLSFVTLLFLYFQITKTIIFIHIALVSPSLRRTSAPVQFTIVWGCVGDTRDSLLFCCRVD